MPSYKNPPVVEVVLSAQFAALDRLTAPHFGLLWQKFRDEFPEVEQHAPIEHVVEAFGNFRSFKSDISFQVMDSPPVPRCWFKNPKGTQLIQVQDDRFMHNWRKTSEIENYPRYPDIRNRFIDELKLFEQFVTTESLGPLVYDQCEVTYISHIPQSAEWKSVGDLDKVLTVWSNKFCENFGAEPEDVKINQRFSIFEKEEPVGRLHLDMRSGLKLPDKSPILVLNLTSRLSPASPNIEGVLQRLDLGRIYIVNAFRSMSTETMRQAWGEYYE